MQIRIETASAIIDDCIPVSGLTFAVPFAASFNLMKLVALIIAEVEQPIKKAFAGTLSD